MTEQEHLITLTEWGLHVVLREGVVIDDNNILPKIQRVIEKCKEINKNRILIDASKALRKVSVMKFIEVDELLAKINAHFKIAFIAPLLVDDEKSKFHETFGFNRGVFIRYFSDEDAAVKWLSEKM